MLTFSGKCLHRYLLKCLTKFIPVVLLSSPYVTLASRCRKYTAYRPHFLLKYAEFFFPARVIVPTEQKIQASSTRICIFFKTEIFVSLLGPVYMEVGDPR